MTVIRSLYPSQQVKRKAPCNLVQRDEKHFGGPAYLFTSQPSFLVKYKGCLVSNRGIIFKHGIPQKEFIVCYEEDFKAFKWRYTANMFWREKKINLPSDVSYLLIFDNYSGPGGFAHWISDGLTKLVELSTELQQCTLLAPYYFQTEPIYLQSLKCFDWKDIFFIPENAYVSVPNLLACTPITSSGDYLPQNVNKLRDRVWKHLDLNSFRGKGSLIYVSRKKASRRFVLNEEDVIKALLPLGFAVLCMEDYGFLEQAAIAREAKILISIHGGALANIHFMKTDSSVLEFRKLKDAENCLFFSLANALNVNYYYQSCQTKENSTNANDFDLIVDTQTLLQHLHHIQLHPSNT